ncbi:MAG: ribonuclease J [bacterium]|nr:ribonuclease J [bacterium]MDZ4231340.1 ribonuclease J [Patescibacteria group bacterium]
MTTSRKTPVKKTPSKKVPLANPTAKRAPVKDAGGKSTGEPLRFVPLGGLEEIGRNMSYLEYEDEIIIMDMGFQFPEEDTPGVDYIIPNIESLLPKKDQIRAVVITHGHMDHIGAIPYLLGRLGNPPIYTLRLTKALIEKRQAEFPNEPKPNIIEVKYGETKKVGQYFEFYFFGVEHTIPDSMGVAVKTPIGNIVHFGDFRLDRDEAGKIARFDEIEKVAKMGVHTYLMDSTDALKEGIGISEKTVEENIERLLEQAKGRIILTTFSSMITRISEIIKIAEKMGKKVAINGRSMRENMDIARNLGIVKAKEGTLISVQEVNKYKDEKVLIITTGAQGEPNSGFMRIVNGEHRHIQLKKTDTVIFSSSVVPGNERSVQALTDSIARQVDMVQNYKLLDIHAGGHAPQEDLKLVMKTLKPKFLVPVHAYYHFRTIAGRLAQEVGIPKENVKLVDNGDVCLLTKDSFEITKDKVDTSYVMVDGLGIGDVEEVVLRDRRMLSADGMVVLIVTIDRRSGRVLKNPDIISRGFIYLRDNQELLKEIRRRIRGIVGRIPKGKTGESDYLKSLFRDQIGQFIYRKTERRPMILPVVIEI